MRFGIMGYKNSHEDLIEEKKDDALGGNDNNNGNGNGNNASSSTAGHERKNGGHGKHASMEEAMKKRSQDEISSSSSSSGPLGGGQRDGRSQTEGERTRRQGGPEEDEGDVDGDGDETLGDLNDGVGSDDSDEDDGSVIKMSSSRDEEGRDDAGGNAVDGQRHPQQQLETDLAAQQRIQQVMAQQHQQQQHPQSAALFNSLNSLMATTALATQPSPFSMTTNNPIATALTPHSAVAQIQQQVLAQQQAAVQAAALQHQQFVSQNLFTQQATAATNPAAALSDNSSPFSNISIAAPSPFNMNINLAAGPFHAAMGNNPLAQQLGQLGLTPNTSLGMAAPSIAPTIAPTASTTPQTQIHTQHHLSPQLTIPHYIPPIPPTWGAQIPALTVQDRPLVPPIYNGINPNYPGVQLLHSHPPIYAVENFLTRAECDFLIHAASDAFGPAPVVGKGAGEVSPSRTSSTCYLAREDLPEYLRKVSLLTGKPPEHCELPQVGRYYPSQQYLQHFDAFDLSNEDGRRFASNGGQRTITVLVYLNDVARGGATHFPNLNMEVQPRQGMALVFFPSTLDGLLDKMALHAALPAVDVKYVSQVWIRQSNYEGRPSKRLPEPMVAGLQERREREELERQQQQQQMAQLLLGQFQHHHQQHQLLQQHQQFQQQQQQQHQQHFQHQQNHQQHQQQQYQLQQHSQQLNQQHNHQQQQQSQHQMS
mmetsp:Transcript_11733/g.24675  ORF Transcript_11733/g.24675 Transcript_11733/m.24675 type:complete len:707 (+) Transcript_11733:290-2410(+)